MQHYYSPIGHYFVNHSPVGVVPKGGMGSNWSKEALDFFANYMNRKFYVLCKSALVGKPCGLVVVETERRATSDGKNLDNLVNRELINRGYADSVP